MDRDEFTKRLNSPVRFKSDPPPDVLSKFLELESKVSDRVTAVGYSGLKTHERAIHNVHWLIAEVMNGGFHQYFWNSAGDDVFDAIESLRHIGSRETLDIVSDACALFPDGRPHKDRVARQDQLEKFNDPATGDLQPQYEDAFDELDRRFCDRREELCGLCLESWANSSGWRERLGRTDAQ